MIEFEAPVLSKALSWLGHPLPWTLAAFLCYLATLTLGILSVRGRPVKRSRHSQFFVLAFAVTVAAALVSLTVEWWRGILLALALVPLALLPFSGVPVAKHLRLHVLIGLSAAPPYLVTIALLAMEAV